MDARPASPEHPIPDAQFATDAIELLTAAIRRAAKHGRSTVGTEHLLYCLVDRQEEAGSVIAPGIRAAGSLNGLLTARAGHVWSSDDGGDGDGMLAGPAGEAESAAAWREALWEGMQQTSARQSGEPVSPATAEPSPALHETLLHALRLARREPTPHVRVRHLTRGLLEIKKSRAREALMLRRTDVPAAVRALDALARQAEPAPVSRTVGLLQRAGVLGGRGTWWVRILMSALSRGSEDRAPVLLVVVSEAKRQAVRCGRDTVEPVDLLLAVLELERALDVAGSALPERLAPANSAAALLRSHGADLGTLAGAATAAEPAPLTGKMELSEDAARVMATARLLSPEHGAETVGTVHLLAALLDDANDPVGRLLRESGVDVAELRAALDGRLGA